MNGSNQKQKIVCVLYDDPVDGYPPKYARDDIPTLTAYPDLDSRCYNGSSAWEVRLT